MLRFILLLALITSPIFSEVPSGLIRQLGDASFAVRQAAEVELAKQLAAEPAMLPELQALSREHADVEVRLRIGSAIRRSGLRIVLHDFELTPAAVSNGTWKVVAGSKSPKGFVGTHSWSNGVLRISSMGPQDHCLFQLPLPNEHRTHGLQVDAELRILELQAGKPRTTAGAVSLEDDRRAEAVLVAKDRVDIYNLREAIRHRNEGWLRLRVVAEGDTFKIYLGDLNKPAKVVPWTRHPTVPARNRVNIGDTGTTTASVTEWRNVRVQVFERRP